MTDDPTSLASAYLDGELDAVDRARVESTPELLAEVDRLRVIRAVLADLPESSISARERHLANALDAWERLPEQERTGALRDGTPSGVDGAAVAGAAAVSRSARRSRRAGRRGMHSGAWLGAAAAGLVIVLAGGLVLRTANSDNDDDTVAESSGDTAIDPQASGAQPTLAVTADSISESEIEQATASEAAPSENASDVDTDVAAEAPPSDTGDLVVLLTQADLADFAAAALDAPSSGNLPADATVITDAPADTAADRTSAGSAPSDEFAVTKCQGADVVVGVASYQGETVVVAIDESRNLAIAYTTDGCTRVATAPLSLTASLTEPPVLPAARGRVPTARLVCSLMPGNPLTDPNWASDTTNKVVSVVTAVREQTTTKAVMAARAIVFGIIAAFLGVFILVITIVLLMRGIQALLDLAVNHAQAVYLSYLIVGGMLCLAGLLLFKKRSASAR